MDSKAIDKRWRLHVLAALVALLLVSVAFFVFPEWDMTAAAWFYDAAGAGFAPRDDQPWRALYLTVIWGVRLFGVALLLLIVFSYLRRRLVWGIPRRHLWSLLLALVLGPGLVVNSVLKDHWGRARPHQIEAFGGDRPFTPVWVISDACEKNCSFVSGHAAAGFYFMLFGWVFPRYFRHWFVGGMVYGGLAGLIRMVQGGHFLSDVLLSGIITYLVGLMLYRLIVMRRASV